MDRFNGVTLAILGSRYGGNECLLVADLTSAGLLKPAPTCSCCSVTMDLYPSEPWKWCCPTKNCSNGKAVVTEGCFLYKKRKFFNVFPDLYQWSMGRSQDEIVREGGLSRRTVHTLDKNGGM